jgi:hypothetical protein
METSRRSVTERSAEPKDAILRQDPLLSRLFARQLKMIYYRAGRLRPQALFRAMLTTFEQRWWPRLEIEKM